MRELIKFTKLESTKDMAYVAGLIDVLGTFNIKKTIRPTHIAWASNVIVRTTDYRIIDLLDKLFGCSRNKDMGHGFDDLPESWGDRKAIKPTRAWVCSGEFLDYVLSITIPYLICNKEKALLVQEFRSTFNGLGRHEVPSEVQEHRDRIRDEFRKLQRPKRGKK